MRPTIECEGICQKKSHDKTELSMWRHSASAQSVLLTLLQVQFSCHGRFIYHISGARDEDGPAACLEAMEFDADGEACGIYHYTGFGEQASLLAAFYNWFLPAHEGQRLKVVAMLRAGITRDEDVRAGLRARDLDALVAAIEAAQRHGIGLHFFIHPKD